VLNSTNLSLKKMNTNDQQNFLLQHVKNVNQRMESLHKSVKQTPWRQPEEVIGCLDQLQSALIDLRRAEEELQQQNEELKRARQSAEHERRRYQDLFESAPDGYLVTSLQGEIREVNRVAASLFNLNQSSLIGETLISLVSREHQRTFQSMLKELPKVNRVQEWEVKLQTLEEESFEAALTVETVRDADGKAIALRWLIRDITTRKKAEEKLRQVQVQNLQLTEVDRLKSQFIAMLSHELRTPMNAILGFSQLLMRQFHHPDPQALHMLERIFSNGQHLLTMIEGMLDFSKLKVNHLELHPQPFDLVELVETTVDELKALAEQNNLRLQMVLPAQSSIPVVNDRARLRQILLNLLANAIKFTDVGTVSAEVFELPEGRVAIVVRDTGIGIDPVHQNQIFNEFWQANQTLTRRHNGMGLGLSIIQALVKLMQGSIALESQLGEGSIFRVELPRDVSTHVNGTCANGTSANSKNTSTTDASSADASSADASSADASSADASD
jgi:PAS domain S-box-containing protein